MTTLRPESEHLPGRLHLAIWELSCIILLSFTSSILSTNVNACEANRNLITDNED